MYIVSFDPGTANFGVLIVEYIVDSRKIDIIHWDVYDIRGKDSILKINEILDEFQHILQLCKFCLIEKQLSKNIKTTRVAHHISSFFKIFWPKVNVIFYNPKLKTKNSSCKTYKERKNYCIEKTIDDLVINNDENNMVFLIQHKKKDDLCDCYQMVSTFVSSKM